MPAGPRNHTSKLMRAYARILMDEGREASFDELTAPVERPRVSRRELLQMGGVLGAGLVLAACTEDSSRAAPTRPSSAAPSDGPRVVVVGAGLAGLTAAYRLTQQGLPVQVYDARDRVGGRCWTVREFDQGQIAEHGGEFVDTRHVHLRGLAKELDLELEDLWEGWVPGSSWPVMVNGDASSWGDVAGDQEVVAAITRAAKQAGILHDEQVDPAAMRYGTATPGAIELDRQSIEEWLSHQVPGFLASPAGRLFDNGMEGWYGLPSSGLGALNLVDYYLVDWTGGDERYHVKGGNDSVVQTLTSALPEGTLQLEAPLERLSKNSDGTYELAFGGGATPVTADRVILTLPFTTLRQVDLEGAGFPAHRMDAIRTHAMGMNTKLNFQIDRAPETFRSLGKPWSGGMQHVDAGWGTWEAVQGQAGKAAVITVFAGGAGGAQFANAEPHGPAPEAMADETIAAANDVVPGIAKSYIPGTSYLDYWPADPWAMGSYAAFGPGQTADFWGYSYQPEGAVHFAGEHTSTYSQGFLNGGVESGQRAAIEVMEALGIDVPKHIVSMPYTPE